MAVQELEDVVGGAVDHCSAGRIGGRADVGYGEKARVADQVRDILAPRSSHPNTSSTAEWMVPSPSDCRSAYSSTTPPWEALRTIALGFTESAKVHEQRGRFLAHRSGLWT